ncbi:MAG: methyltransferase domain-containing protein [Nitrospiraceae bacterium]
MPLQIVVLAPEFGQTQTAYLALSYYLAARGVRVIRFDYSNHIGLSEGSPECVRMSSIEDDLDAILLWVRQQWPDAASTLIAPDLAGRIAVRRSDWHPALRSLLLLNPTFDLRKSLEKLHRRDLVQNHQDHTRFGIGNLMGLNLDIDRFLADTVQCNFTDFESSRTDLATCRVQTTIIRSSPETGDFLIPPPSEDLIAEAVSALGAQGRLETIPGLTLSAAEAVPAIQDQWERFRQLFMSPSARFVPSPLSPALIGRTIAIRSRLERDKLRTTDTAGEATPADLWTDFTTLTGSLDELPAFWQLTDHLYQRAQPVHEGARLLDVGCGVHSFARLLLLNLSYRLRSQAWRHSTPVRYVGVDFSYKALGEARKSARETLDRLDTMFSGRISSHPPVKANWSLSRSIESLPFAADSFERIVANLVICFCPSPLHAVRELFRVLQPGGTLVLSSFRSGTDPATIYRPHLQELGLDEFSGEARAHLMVMARLCKNLRTGYLPAFEEDSFANLVAHATRTTPTIQRAMTGQALIAIVEKPVSAG